MKLIRLSLTLATVGLLLLTANSYATLRTWSGLGADANWQTSGNWDFPPAVNGDSLTFSGSTRQNNTNNYTAITNTAITLSTGGWTLNGNQVTLGGGVTSSTGNNVMNMPLQLTATRTITVTAGQLTLNGVVSSTGAYGLTTAGAGSLVLAGSNTCSGTITLTANAGNLIITNPKALGTGSVSIPHNGTQTGTLQLNLTGANTIANTFGGFNSATGGATGIPQIENVSGTNTITGALIVTGTGGNGLLVQSDAGLLTLAGPVGTTIASRYVQLYGAGNGVVNGSITNSSAGAFPVNKYGSGTWTLNGTNTMTGAVTINAGTLALGATGSVSNAPNVTLAPGTVFDVSAVPGGWSLNSGKYLQGGGVVLGNVTTANGSTSTIYPGTASTPANTQGTLSFSNNLALGGGTLLGMNLSSDPTGLSRPSDQIVVAGNLTASGVNTFALGNYLNGYIPNGTYNLIKFRGALTGDASNFAVSGFTVGARGVQSGYIITNTGVISLVVTGTPPASLTWAGDGVANNWDITTSSNWLNGTNLDKYYNYDAVTFDDTATNFTVNIAATVTPGAFTVNATNNYAFTAASANITGIVGLTKLGSGTLTISNNNDYTGVNTFGGGKVSVATIGTSGTTGPLGAAANNAANQVLNGGTLEYTGAGETSLRAFSIGSKGGTLSVADPNATLLFNTSGSWLSGGNTFTKTGPGTMAFGFQQVMTGTNIINGGTLKIPTVSVFGTDLTTPLFVNTGGALDLGGSAMGTKPVIVSGAGDLTLGITNGAIVNSGAAQNLALQDVRMVGDTVFGGNARWDIRANPVGSLSTGGNAYNLVKVGANFIGLVSVSVDSALANIDVQAGTLSYELSTTGLGNPASTLTVESGATLDFWAAATPLNKHIALYDNSTVTATSGTSTIIGPVNMLGDTAGGPTFSIASGVTLNLNGVVSGAGNLNKSGAGTLTLAGTNTYAGTTTVSAGKLAINSAQTGTGDFTVADGATLDVTVSGTKQLAANNMTLGSAGAVTLEFSALASTTVAPIYATNLNVYSTTNTINILSGNFLSGQTYPLIASDNPNYGAGFVLGTLPPLTTGTLVTNGNAIALHVISSSSVELWAGNVNGNWNIATTPNWKLNGSAATYADGNNVLFDDTASNAIVTVTTTVLPKSVNINNSSLSYSFSGSSIAGTGSVTKLGTAALTLYGANSYSGGTVHSGGTLNIDNNGALGTGPLTINAGTIDANGSGPVTLTNNNPQNWNGDFAFTGNQNLNLGTGAVTMNANRTLTINANTLTVGGGIGDGGNTNGLIKNGTGALALSGTNTYKGLTTVNAGTLTLRGNDSAADGGFLVGPANTGGILTLASNTIVNVAIPNAIRVGNTSAAGTTTAYVYVNASTVTNNGALLSLRASVIEVYNGGTWLQTGDMEVRGVGGYSGDIYVMPNSVFTYAGINTIKLNGAEGNSGNAYVDVEGLFQTPVAFEQTTTSPSTGQGQVWLYGGGTLRLTAAVPELNPLGANPAAVKFVTYTNCGTIDTAGYDTVINNDITGAGGLTKAGAGALTLASDTPISYTNDTRITGGTLVLSNSATLSSTNILIGGGAVLDVTPLATQPCALASYQVLGNLSSTATLNGSVDAATAPAAINLSYAAGTPALTVRNGSLTLAAATPASVNNTGAALGNGSYKLISAGTAGSVAGTVPSAVVVTGNGMGSGGTASLSLASAELYLNVTGAVTVNTTPTNITFGFSGGNLNLSWPADHTGWRLLAQTNHLAEGISLNTNDWDTVAGSASTNQVFIPIDTAKRTEFYRLVYP